MSEICLSYKPKIILTRKCYYNIKGNEMQVFSGIILKRKMFYNKLQEVATTKCNLFFLFILAFAYGEDRAMQRCNSSAL